MAAVEVAVATVVQVRAVGGRWREGGRRASVSSASFSWLIFFSSSTTPSSFCTTCFCITTAEKIAARFRHACAARGGPRVGAARASEGPPEPPGHRQPPRAARTGRAAPRLHAAASRSHPPRVRRPTRHGPCSSWGGRAPARWCL